MLSVYFGAVAAAPVPSAIGPPLAIYELDSRGGMVVSTTNMFEAGQLIWIAVPNAVSPPYTLTVATLSGLTVVSRGDSSLPANGLIAVSLRPTLFPPGTSYAVALQDNVFYSPGFSTPQTSRSGFTVVPALAKIQLKSYSFANRVIQSNIELDDQNYNPLTSVRLGLFLVEGNSSVQVTTEETNLLGKSTFRVGTALSGGNYQFELRVLDDKAILATPSKLPIVTVSYISTILTAWTPSVGNAQAYLRELTTQTPIDGRLLVLEQRLADGNWTVTSQAYTDDTGQAVFHTNTTKTSRVSFNGDDFYTSSRSLMPNTTTPMPNAVSISASVSTSSVSQSLSRTGLNAISINPATGGCGAAPCCTGPSQAPILLAAMATNSKVIPDCGGGGGGTTSTSTTMYLPSPAYATLPAVIAAKVWTGAGYGLSGLQVNFTSGSTNLGVSTTNSTGYASVIWTVSTLGGTTIQAAFYGNSAYSASSNWGQMFVNPMPTTIQFLKPRQIAYSWDLYNYYQSCCKSYGLPIVVPVNILALAPSGSGSPSNTYIPAYTGVSSTPASIAGYGWAGLNNTSVVTLTMNGTYIQKQNVTWTRNFYLPPCPNPPNCSTTPRTGHMNLTATLSPPSSLYTTNTTSLSIPYQNINSLSSGTQLSQTATPPAHLYVNVNASYPYLSVAMQGLPVSLATYNAYLAYTLGGPPSAFLSSGFTYYALPAGTDFAYVCTDSTCSTPAANVAVYLYDYNSKGNLVYCGINGATNNRGVAYVMGNGPTCGYPYAYAAINTSGNTLTISELFHIEAVSNPSPFLTNFQGYNYAVYAPQKTGRYLLDMRTFFLNSAYTVLYPTITYPDVQYPYSSCCDIFLNVEKHPLQAQLSFNPGTATMINSINATIQLTDLAASKPLSNSQVSYTLTRTNPSQATIQSGSLTSNMNGTAFLSLGLLPYGNYTLTISRSATSTLSALSSNFYTTIYRALPTLVLRDVSGLNSESPSIIKYVYPWGTTSTFSIVHSQSNPLEFYEVVGMSTDLLSAFATQHAYAGIYITYQSICPTCSGSSDSGYVVQGYWVNGQLNMSMSCAQTRFTNCSQSVARLTGSNNICGTVYCYRLSVFAGSINSLPLSYWLGAQIFVCPVNNACVNYNNNNPVWGYLANPDGSFLVNGVSVRHADASTPLGSAVSFQFNATSSPNSISSVTMNIFNQTTSTNTIVCLIGGLGCLQSEQTTSNNFLLYAPNMINFKSGSYLVTVTITCPSCTQTTIQVLTLFLVISQSSWSENAVALNPHTYETSLINNTTNTQLTVSGLIENIYINGILYTMLQTDSNGNGLFTWTPQTAGQYTIKSTFLGQNYYANSSMTIIVSVAKRNVILAADNSPQSPSINQQIIWNVYAQDMVSNSPLASLPISLFINDVNTTTVNTSFAGTAVFQPPPSTFGSKGSYNVTFISATNNTYNSGRNYYPLMVYLDTQLTLQAGTITLGQQDTFTISLKDANGATLSNRVLQVKVDGTFYQNVTTDPNGQAQFIWRPDTIGIHSVGVSFLATGSSDYAYRPSSAGLSVDVVTQTTTNTVSTSITQSVNLGTAQGSTQPSSPSPSISITFPDPFTIAVNIQYNGKTAQSSSHLTNVFGLACSWWGCLPYWNVNIDASVVGMFSSHITGPGIGTASGASMSISSAPPSDEQAFDAGATVSGGIALTAIATLASSDIASVSTALLGNIFAIGAGAIAFRNSPASYKSYLLGLLLPPLFAIPCLFAACPHLDDVPIFFLLTAAYIWLTWEEVMFRVLWTAGGFVAALVLGIIIVAGSLLVTLL